MPLLKLNTLYLIPRASHLQNGLPNTPISNKFINAVISTVEDQVSWMRLSDGPFRFSWELLL